MAAVPGSTIVCDVGALGAEIGAVDALARLHLTARRLGVELRFRNARRELAELVVFAGLGEVLRVEVERQPEEREERGGVQEEREFADPTAG